MAKQINFYSVTDVPSSSADAGGIFFFSGNYGEQTGMQGFGEIYKGTQRFGTPRVWECDEIIPEGKYGLSQSLTITDCSAIDNKLKPVRGDIFLSQSDTYIYTGNAWAIVKVDHNANLSGIVSSLSVGNSNSYIKYISQSGDGKVTAYAGTFPTLNLGSTTKSGSSNGVTVSVTTQSGAVTGVTVAAPTYTATQVTKSGTSNAHTVSVTTKNGQVTAVTVAAPAAFTKASIGDGSASGASNGIQVDVTTTSGIVTAVAVSNPFVATEVTKSGTSNGVTVGVTTKNGQVTAVTVAASEIANVMHFKGTSTTLPSWGESTAQKAGDIWIVGANPTGYITSSGWGSTASAGNTKLVAGQEYVKTSTGGFELIGDQNTYATKAYVDASVTSLDGAKASIGTATAASFKGLRASVSLKSDAAPTMAFFDGGIITSASEITSSADKFVTASAIANYVTGKLPASGFGTAATKDFATTIIDGGVSLPTQDAVYDFVVGQISALDSTVAQTSGPVNVNITQTDGILTACTVVWDASAGKNGVTASSSKGEAWSSGPNVTVSIASTTAHPTVTLGGWGSAAAKGVVTASGSFKTANYSLSLPTAQAVAAYADGLIAALDSTVTSTSGGLSIAVTQTDGKLTSCACQFVWLDGTGAVIP